MKNKQRECLEKTQSERGLACRHCRAREFRVIYTRRAVGGTVVRRRACLKCGKRITTREKEIGAG
jgi:transcriptional regulator NrdR family protein